MNIFEKRLNTRLLITFLSILIPQTVFGDYIFTAPPRETTAKGNEVYGPIAEFLTRATGETFIYKQQDNWPEYVSGMRADKFDLIFDGPHFVDWRIQNLEHNTIVKVPHLLQWRVITRKDDASITKLEDLVGKKTCAPGAPNFGMLNLFNHFKDKAKQPIHVEVKGWNNVYESVKKGDCVAGVLPKKNHEMFDKENLYTKAIHTHLPYPNQAMTAGKHVPNYLKEKIREALLSDKGKTALVNLRKRYTGMANLVSVEDEEYDSIYLLLLKEKSFTDNNHSTSENGSVLSENSFSLPAIN